MKKVLFVLSFSCILLFSCGDEKKKEAETQEVQKKSEVIQEKVASDGDLISMGEKLFNEKTCVACHQLDTKVVGPSIKSIAAIYKEKNGNLVQFLKGVDDAIVDTDPGQVSIMKANLDGFVKDLNNNQLEALAAYIQNSIK